MIDINRALKSVVKTGEVYIGEKQCKKAIKSKSAKLIIRSSNCPLEAAERIEKEASAAGTKVYVYDGTSIDLGRACGKPFLISILAILNQGESKILNI
jgi:large subunit ribosomal protein L30e